MKEATEGPGWPGGATLAQRYAGLACAPPARPAGSEGGGGEASDLGEKSSHRRRWRGQGRTGAGKARGRGGGRRKWGQANWNRHLLCARLLLLPLHLLLQDEEARAHTHSLTLAHTHS